MSGPDLAALIKEMIAQPRETEWLEFKHNNSDPSMRRTHFRLGEFRGGGWRR
jgi:hypothetical protein